MRYDIPKIVVSILEHHVKNVLGDDAIKEIKKPVLEQEFKESIACAAQHAEQRWLTEYSDREVVAAISQMPLHNLPVVQKSIRRFYDHPSEPITTDVIRGQLHEVLPEGISAERIEAAVAAYLEFLRNELINLEGLVDRLNFLVNIQTNNELREIHGLLARVFTKELDLPSLYKILPKRRAGQEEFHRIVQLLLFHEARHAGRSVPFPRNIIDYPSLPEFYEARGLSVNDGIAYLCRFVPSPLTTRRRTEIHEIIDAVAHWDKDDRPRKFILVTPCDFHDSSDHKGESELAWFKQLQATYRPQFQLEHWGHLKLLSLFRQSPRIALFYYPEMVENGQVLRRTIQDTARRYFDNLSSLYHNIEFVGMSVYKPEATKGVPMEHIYIPLQTVPVETEEERSIRVRIDPLDFLIPGTRHVILGDPGSGKSTLLKFLALVGTSRPLQRRYKARSDKRLPILVILRRYADELKSRLNLSLLDYIQESIQADFSLESANLDFFEYYFESGQTILLFDGLDELANPHLKELVNRRIRSLLTTYPGNTAIVTSRIVGYDHPFRFNDEEFDHHKVAPLRLPEIEQFVSDWYAVRIENLQERRANIADLVRILRSEEHQPIRALAENPLLLTIIALVHRIDAVLPDERVVLYQKCTETLLNTWHTWKYRETEIRNRGKVERRNRRRIEAIASWMQNRLTDTTTAERAVVPYEELKSFLTEHIENVERSVDPDNDPVDLAEEFLDFVKRRAGLLVEVGDNTYSFVHLTFQEYLTAAHIITTSERGGATHIWEAIGTYTDNSNWHEVIRLLVAGLRSNEAQDWLIERILEVSREIPHVNRSLLLGGLLIDGIEAAELQQQAILEHLLLSAASADDSVQLRRVISMLRAVQVKGANQVQAMTSAFQNVWERAANSKVETPLALIACSLGWPLSKIEETITGNIIPTERENTLLEFFFGDTANPSTFQSLLPDIKLLKKITSLLALESPSGNLIGAVTLALAAPFGRQQLFKWAFEACLTQLSVLYSGPFEHFLLNILDTGLNNRDNSPSRLIKNMDKHRVEAMRTSRTRIEHTQQLLKHLAVSRLLCDSEITQALQIDHILEVIELALERRNELSTRTEGDQGDRLRLDLERWANKQNLDQRIALKLLDKVIEEYVQDERVMIRIRQMIGDRSIDVVSKIEESRRTLNISSRLRRGRVRSRSLRLDTEQSPNTSGMHLENYDSILDLWCSVLAHELQPQWHEALQIAFAPKIPGLITPLFDEEQWHEIAGLFESGTVGATEVYGAAWLLLLEVWLYYDGYAPSQLSSVFTHLAEITYHIDVAPLRIAHCIRDIAYGTTSRLGDLTTLLCSDNPSYQEIFEEALWLRKSEEAVQQVPKA